MNREIKFRAFDKDNKEMLNVLDLYDYQKVWGLVFIR